MKARSIFSMIYVTALILIFTPLNAQIPQNYNQADQVLQKGYLAFIDRDYTQAYEYILQVESFISNNPRYKDFFDHHYRDFSLLDIIEQRKKLGNIKPDIIHKILVIYIMKTDATFQGIQIREEFTEEMEQKSWISQEIAALYVEVLSEGKITLEFSRTNLDAVVTDLKFFNSEDNGKKQLVTVHADPESIQPYPGDMMYQLYNKYDTILYYWSGEQLKSEKKGRATAMGGSDRLALIPYSIYGPERGRIIISSCLVHRPGTLLHEFFHTIEKRYAIPISHGFWDKNRHQFPTWKGQGEYNYYQYHFENTIKKSGYRNCEFTYSQPLKITSSEYQSYVDMILPIRLEDRKEAQHILEETKLIFKNDKKNTKKNLEKAILLNPYNGEALFKLCGIAHYNGDLDLALSYILRAYQISPYDPYVCYWMGVEHYHKNMMKESIRYLSESIHLSPDYAGAWMYRGFVNFQMGRYKDSLADYRQCTKITEMHNPSIREFLNKKSIKGNKHAEWILKELEL